MNPALVKKALEKVLDRNVLVNLVSQRVRQLTAGGGSVSRSLVANAANLGVADIALHEITEGKMGFEMPEFVELTRPTATGRKRPQHWAKNKTWAADEEGGAKDFAVRKRKRALTHG